MSGRIVARTLSDAALTGTPRRFRRHAAVARRGFPPGGGAVEDVIALPDGFQPEGITIDPARYRLVSARWPTATSTVADVRTGEGEVISEGPGTPSVGLKVDQSRPPVRRGRAHAAPPASSTRRTGDVLDDYQFDLGAAFVNDVVADPTTAPGSPTAQRARALPAARSGVRRSSPTRSTIVALPLTATGCRCDGFNANGIAETPDGKALPS